MPVLPCLGGDGRGAHGVGWPAVSPPWGFSIKYSPQNKNLPPVLIQMLLLLELLLLLLLLLMLLLLLLLPLAKAVL